MIAREDIETLSALLRKIVPEGGLLLGSGGPEGCGEQGQLYLDVTGIRFFRSDGRGWSFAGPDATAALPKWRSRSEVEAFQITDFYSANSQGVLLLGGAHQVIVEHSVFRRMTPAGGSKELVGGYYVRHADGYEGWSPAKAFEEGYTAL